jgi:hypothetical protein
VLVVVKMLLKMGERLIESGVVLYHEQLYLLLREVKLQDNII